MRVLRNQIGRGEVGHAYLFCGPRGTGKTSVARIFARAVNCEHPLNGSPCGACETCRALAGNTLDIVEIDAASNNGVNEMRDLREKVQYPPVSGKYKVYIVDEVHMLTDSAFNALLKTLEEPPVHAVFILATTEPHKIPATILSRCMRLDFKLIPEEDLERHLEGILREIGKPYEREAVAAIARAGAGSDRDMLSVAEMCLAYGDKLTYDAVTAVLGTADVKTTAALVGAMLACDLSSALSSAETLLAEGKGVGVLLRDMLALLNEVAVAKTCANAEKLLSLPQELFAAIRAIADAADGRTILRATEILAKTESELRFSSSPRIALETAIMRVTMPEAERDVDALLVRINALEKRLAAGGAQSAAQVGPEPRSAERVQERVPQPAEAELPVPDEAPPFDEAPLPDEPPFAAYGRDEGGPFATVSPAPERARSEERTPAQADGETPASAEQLFGLFLRKLRKLPKSGVLYALCRDLEPSFGDGKLVLTSDVRTVCDSLNGANHRPVMADVFAELGVSDFEICYEGAPASDAKDAIEQLKKDFSDYPVDVK